MTLLELVETFAAQAFRVRPEIGELPIQGSADPAEQAVAAAQSLRDHGLPVQAYRLLSSNGSDAPALPPALVHQGTWQLQNGDSADPGWGSVRVSEPPVGRAFTALDGRTAPPAAMGPPDVFICYAVPGDPGELADRQLTGDLRRLLSELAPTGRRPLYVDAVGLVPEGAVRSLGSQAGEAESRFNEVLALLQRQVAQTARGHAPADAHSPIWRRLGEFVAAERIPSVLEGLPFALWREIVDLDRQGLRQFAARFLYLGRTDKAAETALQFSTAYHQLNKVRRDEAFAQQLLGLARDEPAPVVLTCRELDHYGRIEAALTGEGLQVWSLILGDEPLSTLLRAPLLGGALLDNMGVAASEDARKTRALRDCVKWVVQMACRRPDMRWAARAFEALDGLSEEEIDDVVRDLSHPARLHLRQNGQDPAWQLLYLLRDRGYLPLDVDLCGLEGGGT